MADAARSAIGVAAPAPLGLRHGRVVACFRPQRRGLALLLALQVAQALATLMLPHLSAELIDGGVARGDRAEVIRLGSRMLGLSLLQVGLAVSATVLGARLAMRYGRDLRALVFAQVQGFSLQEMNHFGTPSLITRSTNDVLQL